MTNAKVINIMIASPGNTDEERKCVKKTIDDWNVSNFPKENVMLKLLSFDNDAPLGETAENCQDIIDGHITDNSDMVIGIFKNTLGRTYDEFTTYTVHEIKKHIQMGKPVLLFIFDGNKVSLKNEEEIQKYNDFLKFKNEYKGILGKDLLFQKYTGVKNFKDNFPRRFTLSINEYISKINSIEENKGERNESYIPNDMSLKPNDSSYYDSNNVLFFTQDKWRPPETKFLEMLPNTKKFYFMARRGTGFINRYEANLKEAAQNGCDCRFMITDPKSRIMQVSKTIPVGFPDKKDDPKIEKNNMEISLSYLESIKESCPPKIEVRVSDYYPTFDIEYFEYKDGREFLLMQTHFVSASLRAERPMFVLEKNSPLFDVFYRELNIMWENAKVPSIKKTKKGVK